MKSRLKECSMGEIGCVVFILLMFLIFPIFFTTDFYFNLNISKLYFFIAATSLLFIFFLFDLFQRGKTNIKKSGFIKTDVAMILLCAVSLISGVASEYFPHTWLGVNGRYNGMLIMIMYTIIYFIVTRFLKNSFDEIFLLLAISSSLVYLLGILNCFGIDLFHAFDRINSDQKNIFMSTIGNRNFFSTFICISLPIVLVMFCKLKSKMHVIFYGIVTILGFFALYCSNTDSGFVGIFFTFMFLTWFLFDDINYIRKYLFSMLIMVVTGIIFYNMSQYMNIHSDILKILNKNFILTFIAIFLSIVFLLTYVPHIFGFVSKNMKKVKISIFSIYIFIIILCIILFVLCSFVGLEFNIEGINKYFKFSNSWGSFRGSAWICLLSIIPKLSFFQVFFGTGPDTIFFVFRKYYFNEIQSKQILNFDSAHNEYLQYLVTIGFLGFLMYLILVCCAIHYGFKMAKTSTYALACVLSVLSYVTQGIFNISMISTTPIFFTIVVLIIAQYKHSYKHGSVEKT